MLAAMEPSPRANFEPAGAGALLGGVTAASVGIGALVGWAAGVFTVYRRYRDAF
jgi:hypothetical protein